MARDLPSKSWHNLHSLLQKEDSLFDVLSYLQGVTWEACVQIIIIGSMSKTRRVTG